MTEQEWQASADPQAMLRCCVSVSARKARLFACACCRRIWHLLRDDRSRQAVEVAERYADGQATEEERAAAQTAAWAAAWAAAQTAASSAERAAASSAASSAAWAAAWAAAQTAASSAAWAAAQTATWDEAWDAEQKEQAAILRDIVGNPWWWTKTHVGQVLCGIDARLLTWNDHLVTRLAERIYQERAFELMPLLGDALLDAGCENEDLLHHCHQPGTHTRGCWVVDLLLGKE